MKSRRATFWVWLATFLPLLTFSTAGWGRIIYVDSGATGFNNGESCLYAETDANYNGTWPYSDCPAGPYVGRVLPVGSYPANEFQLYDMHGNLYEWCNDLYGNYYGDETNPCGPSTGSRRVFRGGEFASSGSRCRSADRSSGSPDDVNYLGFRPVISRF